MGLLVIRMKPFDAKTKGLLLDSVSTLAYLQERYRQGTGLRPVRYGEGMGLRPIPKVKVRRFAPYLHHSARSAPALCEMWHASASQAHHTTTNLPPSNPYATWASYPLPRHDR